MNKKGFTMVELISVLTLMGIIMLIVLPNTLDIYNTLLRTNLINKISSVQQAAEDYGNGNIKDEIKEIYVNGTSANDAISYCYGVTINELITNGYLVSDYDASNGIENPVTKTQLLDLIHLCYSTNDYKVHAYYAMPFSISQTIYKGQYVVYEDNIYECLQDSIGNHINDTDEEGKNYFRKVSIV